MLESRFGTTPDGQPVRCLTIGSPPGPVLEVLTLGATVHRLEVAGGDGVRRNVVLGHADVADRLASSAYLGGTIGRYANRIAGGRFPLDGREVQVGVHDRGNSLHGGPDGFDRRIWSVVSHEPDQVVLGLVSPDGDQGFPGELTVRVAYRVDGDVVRIELSATTDAPTVVNLTNHAYFNLDGAGAGTIDDHLLQVHADEFTPVDPTGIPLGDHAPVDGTPFDFRAPSRIGDARPDRARAGRRGPRGRPQLRRTRRRTQVATRCSSRRGPGPVSSCCPTSRVCRSTPATSSTVPAPGERGRLHRQGDGIALEPQLFPDSPAPPRVAVRRAQAGSALPRPPCVELLPHHAVALTGLDRSHGAAVKVNAHIS